MPLTWRLRACSLTPASLHTQCKPALSKNGQLQHISVLSDSQTAFIPEMHTPRWQSLVSPAGKFGVRVLVPPLVRDRT